MHRIDTRLKSLLKPSMHKFLSVRSMLRAITTKSTPHDLI